MKTARRGFPGISDDPDYYAGGGKSPTLAQRVAFTQPPATREKGEFLAAAERGEMDLAAFGFEPKKNWIKIGCYGFAALVVMAAIGVLGWKYQANIKAWFTS